MLNFDQFVAGYLRCATWASGEEIDGNSYAKETVSAMQNDCIAFYRDNKKLLDDATKVCSSETLGHDFWLTRCHHGSGFWDRKELEYKNIGQKLTNVVGHGTKYPSRDLYLGDDGLIYID